MRVAVVNAGTGTVKAALVEVGEDGAARVLARHTVEVQGDEDREKAFREALAGTGARADTVDAVGHRVVHGGRRFRKPVRVDGAVEAALEELCALAPLHNPPALEGIRLARRLFPRQPMVAAFDTAFHAGRAPESTRYALPIELAESFELDRYGFHGLAHASLVEALAQLEGTDVGAVTAVTLQLGAGCSACAVEAGRSIETSMGFTPLEGLVMATRSGDVDPSVALLLLRHGHSLDDVEALLNRRSGLLGLAGSADLREVLRAEKAGDGRARLAVAIFVRRIVATAGAYLTLLGGRGAVVFGGGIGTHSAEIRTRVAQGLAAWNVALDRKRNEAGRPGRISAPESRPVYLLETDEERLIARDVARVLAGGSARDGSAPPR